MAISTINGIPVYEALLSDEETGMFKISLVHDPAVQSLFLAFQEEKSLQLFQVHNDEKRIVRGVVMRADYPIYRHSKEMGEYYIIYHAEQIRAMAEKYLLESRQNDVNLSHNDKANVDGVQMVQYFIKDSEGGINPKGFEDISDGSLFAEFHVVNDDVWKAIKEGKYQGFSLEGVFDLAPESNQREIDDIVKELEGAFMKMFKNEKNMSSKLERLKAALAKALQEFGSTTTDKGVIYWEGEEDLVEGMKVYGEDEEGTRTSLADGDYTTEDGKVIKVVNGEVSEIIDTAAEVAEENEAEGVSEADDVKMQIQKMEASYDEKTRLIADAVRKEFGDSYVQEASDDYCVASTYKDGNLKMMRFDVSWAEGMPSVSNPIEVKMIFVPVDFEYDWGGSERNEEMEAIRKENEELKAEVESLKSMPMANSAHEEVVTSGAISKTGIKGIDRIKEILG